MANTFSTVNNTFIGNLVLDQFVATLAPLAAFTSNCTNQVAFRGDTVKILNVQTSSAALDYADTGTYVMQHAEASGIDVTLNKHKYTSVELKDTEVRDAQILSAENFYRSKGYGLALAVMSDLMTFVSSSFKASTTTVSASPAFSSSAVVGLTAVADNANWTPYNRAMVLNPTQHSYLRQDSNILFSQIAASLMDKNATKTVSSLDDWHIYKTGIVPTQTCGYICVPQALCFASRVVAPQTPNQYSDMQILTDPDSGLAITQLQWHNPDSGARRLAWIVNYGYALGLSTGCRLLVN